MYYEEKFQKLEKLTERKGLKEEVWKNDDQKGL